MWLQSNRTRTEITEPILDCRFRFCIARWRRANGHAACERHARRHGRWNRCGSWSSTGRSVSCMSEDPVASIPIPCRLFASGECRDASRSGAPAWRAWTTPIRGRDTPNGTSSPCYAWQWRYKSNQPHLASHRVLLRSCIGKVAAWINEAGWQGCGKSGK